MPLKYAAYFIVDIKGRTPLLRYSSGHNKGLYTGPGGHIDKEDKNSHMAALRELYEETGINFTKLEFLGGASWTRKKETKIYVAKVTKIPRIILSSEHDDVKIVNIKNLNNYPLTAPYKNCLEKNLSLLNLN